MIKYIFALIPFFLISCTASKDESFTYFGGKIINPKDDHVIVFDDNEKVIDSIELSKDNTFLGKLENIKSGLYYFKHGSELQYVYLEPKDSLLLRLNTWDFDESLVFSGTNATRNNLLIETFLSNEEQHRNFYKYYKLPAKEFKSKIDSLSTIKEAFLENYKLRSNETSENFLSILKTALHYPLYTKLESFIIDNSLKAQPEVLDKSFISHRNVATLNNENLMFYSPYRDYVYNNLYSDIYKQNIHDESDDFTIALLNAINTKISSQKFKNNLLKKITIRHFYNKSSCIINKKAFETFSSFSTNEDDKKEIALLLKDAKKIKKNTSIPDFKLNSPDGSKVSIHRVLKKRSTAIYFRNKRFSSDSWVASRMNYLIHNNPEIQFLVVNINDNKDEYIKDLGIKHQFYLNGDSEAHEFLTSKFPRMILVNDSGRVINGFCNLNSKKIENQIADL
ncbi:TlpA family protein disulfide reductase [Tenacibaculum agarivorans]|uniref:TlpA family protein disulfide reductase n=1 Tax=Tenacibaculum agarivorans TaxID=1908389 RepID=UPI00094BC05A|nr:hypothetical protein [Tenacibaculum agarivorans]